MLTHQNNSFQPLLSPTDTTLLPQPGYLPPSQLALLLHKQLKNLSKWFQGRESPVCNETGKKINSLLKQFDPEVQRNNSQKRSLSYINKDVDDVERIQKKIKLDEVRSNFSTEDEEHCKSLPDDRCSFSKTKNNKIQSKIRYSKRKIDSVIIKKEGNKSQDSKTENTSFISEKERLVFKMIFYSQEGKYSYLTREEIIKEDPLLLLYFYENHLQFTKTPHFQPKTLKKI